MTITQVVAAVEEVDRDDDMVVEGDEVSQVCDGVGAGKKRKES